MRRIAQLIKLRDYISRYETNPFHYPPQYIRLKQENWRKIHEAWENELEYKQKISFLDEETETEKKRRLSWNPFQKKQSTQQEEVIDPERILPRTKEDLVQYFLDRLYPFQLKWASSTISQVSYTDQTFNDDPSLKFFMQRFPDIYLVMYHPIFTIKNAPIDGEIILISPVEIEIITLMNDHPNATIVTSDERSWTIETENDATKVISPLISLKRTEQIVKSILNSKQINFPIKKTVLSQMSNILYATEPYNTSIIGKREFDEWFTQKRNLTSPLKSEQLKAAEALLSFCQSTSVRRPEWDTDDEDHLNSFTNEEM